MKKKAVQSLKLQLNKTVVHPLTNNQLSAVLGGATTKKDPDKPLPPPEPRQPPPLPTFSGDNCTSR